MPSCQFISKKFHLRINDHKCLWNSVAKLARILPSCRLCHRGRAEQGGHENRKRGMPDLSVVKKRWSKGRAISTSSQARGEPESQNIKKSANSLPRTTDKLRRVSCFFSPSPLHPGVVFGFPGVVVAETLTWGSFLCALASGPCATMTEQCDISRRQLMWPDLMKTVICFFACILKKTGVWMNRYVGVMTTMYHRSSAWENAWYTRNSPMQRPVVAHFSWNPTNCFLSPSETCCLLKSVPLGNKGKVS